MSRSRSRSLWVVLPGVVLATALACASPATALNLSSTFNSDAEGWTVSQGGGSMGSPPPFSAATWVSDGTGAGHIHFADTSDETSCTDNCLFGLFRSPDSWQGNALSNYGGTLSFKFRTSTIAPAFPVTVDLISGGELFVAHDNTAANESTDPTTGYTTYSISLTPSAWTQHADGTEAPDPPMTEVDFQDVLANFHDLIIFADYGPEADGADLDEVSISGGSAPPPLEFARQLTIKVGKRAVSGQVITQPDEYGRSGCSYGEREVTVYRKRKGPDKVIGADPELDSPSNDAFRSLADYKVKAKRKPGTYYATVDMFVQQHHDYSFTCLGAKSPNQKVK